MDGRFQNPLAAAIDVRISPDVIIQHDSLEGVHLYAHQNLTQHLRQMASLSS